jgi:hypothetical protein
MTYVPNGTATAAPYVPWYTNVDEYAFVECMLICCMVALALFFETIHHYAHHSLEHHVEKGARKGSVNLSKTDIITTGHKHGLYMLRLLDRLSDELMVLGFLAFTVWSCNKAKVYDMVVADDYGPNNAADLLHVIEDVHMHLFMAMLSYFYVMKNVVHEVESAIHTWTTHEATLRAKDFPSDLTDADLVEEKKRCQGCLDRGNSLKDYHAIRTHFVEWMEHGGQAKLKLRNFDKRFDFGTYLTVYIDEFMDDLLHIHNTTWYFFGGIWLLIGVLAKTAFKGTKAIDQAVLMFAVIADVILLFFVFLVQRQYASAEKQRRKGTFKSAGAGGAVAEGPTDDVPAIAGDAADGIAKLASTSSFKHVVELLAMRFIQAILLFMCYFIARFVGNPKSWDLTHFDTYHSVPAHWAFIIVAVLILTLGMLVPELVVELNVMMRTPPFVDEEEGHVIQLIQLMDPDCVGLGGKADPRAEKVKDHLDLHEQAKEARGLGGGGGSRVEGAAKNNQVMPVPVQAAAVLAVDISEANFTDPSKTGGKEDGEEDGKEDGKEDETQAAVQAVQEPSAGPAAQAAQAAPNSTGVLADMRRTSNIEHVGHLQEMTEIEDLLQSEEARIGL